jgi:hypothetical protein
MLTTPRAPLALLLLVAVAAPGCSGAKNKIVPVEGKVVFVNGKALPAGTQVRLDPAEGGVQTASATIGEDGSFSLRHASGASGAEVGKYTVVLLPPPKEKAPEFFRSVPKPYYDGGYLTAEVKEGMAPLELKVQPLRQE